MFLFTLVLNLAVGLCIGTGLAVMASREVWAVVMALGLAPCIPLIPYLDSVVNRMAPAGSRWVKIGYYLQGAVLTTLIWLAALSLSKFVWMQPKHITFLLVTCQLFVIVVHLIKVINLWDSWSWDTGGRPVALKSVRVEVGPVCQQRSTSRAVASIQATVPPAASLEDLVGIAERFEAEAQTAEELDQTREQHRREAAFAARNSFLADYAKYRKVQTCHHVDESVRNLAWKQLALRHSCHACPDTPGSLEWIGGTAFQLETLASGTSLCVQLDRELALYFVWIEPGSFVMGSPTGESGRFDNEGPLTPVTLTSGFWMARFPVTRRQWAHFFPDSNCSDLSTTEDLPMTGVTWNAAMEYCRRLTGAAREQHAIPAQFRFSLPLESEWEYACRAGPDSPDSGGSAIDAAERCDWNRGARATGPRPVGLTAANKWGLHDMLGNVYEWCHDWYHPNLSGRPVTDPAGASMGTSKVLRGGSWKQGSRSCRPANRGHSQPHSENEDAGFRLVLTCHHA